MIILNKITVVHNGYDIKYFDKMSEVEDYINIVIQNYKHLSPVKVFDRTIPGNKTSGGSSVKIVRYRYNTLYEEDFIIDFD